MPLISIIYVWLGEPKRKFIGKVRLHCVVQFACAALCRAFFTHDSHETSSHLKTVMMRTYFSKINPLFCLRLLVERKYQIKSCQFFFSYSVISAYFYFLNLRAFQIKRFWLWSSLNLARFFENFVCAMRSASSKQRQRLTFDVWIV